MIETMRIKATIDNRWLTFKLPSHCVRINVILFWQVLACK